MAMCPERWHRILHNLHICCGIIIVISGRNATLTNGIVRQVFRIMLIMLMVVLEEALSRRVLMKWQLADHMMRVFNMACVFTDSHMLRL